MVGVTFGWSPRIILFMSASDCELCGSPMVTRLIFPLLALVSVHGVRGSVLDFFGVFFLDDLEDGVMDFLLRDLLSSRSFEIEEPFVADNDFRSDDCNGERRTPSNSSIGIADLAVCRNDGKVNCLSLVLMFTSSNDGWKRSLLKFRAPSPYSSSDGYPGTGENSWDCPPGVSIPPKLKLGDDNS